MPAPPGDISQWPACKRRYWRLREAGLCILCEDESGGYAYCKPCRAGRGSAYQRKSGFRKRSNELTAKLVALYCSGLTAREAAAAAEVKESVAIKRIGKAGVARQPGEAIYRSVAMYIDRAVSMHIEGKSYAQISRELGLWANSSSNLCYMIDRWIDATQKWVDKALRMHRAGKPWVDIAAKLGRDVDDCRVFVSRRVAYERAHADAKKERAAA